MQNVEVFLTVRVHESDGYIDYEAKTPTPWVLLSTGIKRRIKQLLEVK